MKKKLSILHLIDETKIFYKNSIFNMTISSIETFTKMMKLLGHDIFQKDITQYNEIRNDRDWSSDVCSSDLIMIMEWMTLINW